MPNETTSPLATYVSHLEKGELAYQFSPAANRAVFFPSVLCPFTGSDRLEWRISGGHGSVYATAIVHPEEGQPLYVPLNVSKGSIRLWNRGQDVQSELGTIG